MIMIILSSLISLLNMIATHILLTRKRSIKYCIVAYILNTVGFYIAVMFTKRYITDPYILKYILYFLAFLFIIYICLVFEESISKKIFAMFSIWLFSTVLLFIAIAILDASPVNADVNTFQYLVYVIRICLEALLLPVVYFKVSKLYKKVMIIIPDKMVNLMSLYPVTSFFLIIKNNQVTYGQHPDLNSVFDVPLVLVLISLGYMLIFVGIASSSKAISLKYNYQIIENQVELQRQNYQKLNESLQQMYTAKHDFRQHISAIRSMMQQEKLKEALEYIEQFNQNELSNILPTLCHNFVADSIVKYYMSLAISKSIIFQPQLNIPEEIGIKPLDLCVVLGNCLENAIEACEKLGNEKEKTIKIESHIVGALLVIKILNNYNGQIIKFGETIQSTKNDASHGTHGIGLNSVFEIVHRYNGDLDIKYTQDEFEVDIIMNIKGLS